jgi:hypothetical protein
MPKQNPMEIERYIDEPHEDWMIRKGYNIHSNLLKNNGYIFSPRFFKKIRKIELKQKFQKTQGVC